MDAAAPGRDVTQRSESTRTLLVRLWREHVRHHKPRLLLVLLLTALMAGTTALYPVVIDHAFEMFADRDRRILYQIPALVVAITSIKAAAQYFQNVQVQQVVLLVIRELQGRMFAHLARADLARLEREAPAQLAARFTTDATIVRDALTRAVNGIADAVTVIGLIGSMLYLDWLLSLIAAALYPLAAVPIQRIGKRIRRASGGMQERMGETAAMLNESFAQARTVRAYRLEERRRDRAEDGLHPALSRADAHDQEPRARRSGAGGAGRRGGRRGYRLRRLARRDQLADHRQLHRLRRRAADRGAAAARAGLAECRACRKAWPDWRACSR